MDMELLQITSGVIFLLTALLQMAMVNSLYPKWLFFNSSSENTRCIKETMNPKQCNVILVLIGFTWIVYLIMLLFVAEYVVLVFMFIGYSFMVGVFPKLSYISFIVFSWLLVLPWLSTL